MESNSTENEQFRFLTDPQVQRHFAELNVELLRGKHLMQSAPALFGLLEEHLDDFERFYDLLYGLKLEKRTHDSCTYYYLEFPNSGKGRLSALALYYELDAKSTIVACILANLYFSKYFSYDKKYCWDDIQYEIEHGEYKDSYQDLFFNERRSEYSDKEWAETKRQFNSVISFFHKIGLVEKEDVEETTQFVILPTIHRFIELYQQEIENIDKFLNQIKL